MKLIPKGRIILIFILPAATLCLSYLYPVFFNVSISLNILFLFLVCLDAALSFKMKNIGVEVEREQNLFSIGRKSSILLDISNGSVMKIRFRAKLCYPEEILDLSIGLRGVIKPRSSNEISFDFKPLRRGKYILDYLYMRISSIFSFFEIEIKEKVDIEIHVFPDILQLKFYLKLLKRDRTQYLGINRNIWKGRGSELDSLREYRTDDDSKFIDWKASTRLNKPITKVFRVETNNNIVVALDCGRLMTAEQDGITTVDHAVNSLLMLSYITLSYGDIMHITTFSDRILSDISNIKGKAGLGKITKFITKVEPDFVESNYNLIFNHLQKKLKKRSLIFFLTDIIDDINYTLLKKWTHAFSKRHLVIFILLRDVILSTMAERPVKSTHGLFIQAASRDMFLRRDKVIARLRHLKVNIMDILPNQLTGKMLNKYLEIKSKSSL